MNSNIPQAAARLLDLIGNTEAPKGYETIFGNNQRDLSKPLTKLSLADVISFGPGWTKNYGSSACGRYQFMCDTLKSLRDSEHLAGTTIFSPDLQDNLGYALLDRRGFEKFSVGMLSTVEFGLSLAKEWASFPVLADCKGAHRPVKRGETFYAGDKLNRALITPEQVEAALANAAVIASTSRVAMITPPSALSDAASADDRANDIRSDNLTPVNRALGTTIGNILNGYKTGIGTVGLLGTALLNNYSTSISDPGVLSSLHSAVPAIQPLSAAMLVWGVLGKVDKWVAEKNGN